MACECDFRNLNPIPPWFNDREIHGARNILILFLTKVIKVLSPQGTYSLNITEPLFGGFGVLT
jgi:hypothetical protein